MATHLFGEYNQDVDEVEEEENEFFDLEQLQNESFRQHVLNLSIGMSFAKNQFKTEKSLSKIKKMNNF